MSNKKQNLIIGLSIALVVIVFVVIALVRMFDEKKTAEENPPVTVPTDTNSEIDLRIETFMAELDSTNEKVYLTFVSYQPKEYNLVSLVINEVEYFIGTNEFDIEFRTLNEEANVLEYRVTFKIKSPKDNCFELTEATWSNNENIETRYFELKKEFDSSELFDYRNMVFNKNAYSFNKNTDIYLYYYNPFKFDIVPYFLENTSYELSKTEQVGLQTKLTFSIKKDVLQPEKDVTQLTFSLACVCVGSGENQINFEHNIEEKINFYNIKTDYLHFENAEVNEQENAELSIVLYSNVKPVKIYFLTLEDEVVNVDFTKEGTFVLNNDFFTNLTETEIKIIGFGYYDENVNEIVFVPAEEKVIKIKVIYESLNLTATIDDTTKLYGEVNKVYINYSNPEVFSIQKIVLTNDKIIEEFLQDEKGYYFETKIDEFLAIKKVEYTKNEVQLIDDSIISLNGTLKYIPEIASIEIVEVFANDPIICSIKLNNSEIEEKNIAAIYFDGVKIEEFDLKDNQLIFDTKTIKQEGGSYSFEIKIVYKNEIEQTQNVFCTIKTLVEYKNFKISEKNEILRAEVLFDNPLNCDILKIDYVIETENQKIYKQANLSFDGEYYHFSISADLDDLDEHEKCVISITKVYFEYENELVYQSISNAYVIVKI